MFLAINQGSTFCRLNKTLRDNARALLSRGSENFDISTSANWCCKRGAKEEQGNECEAHCVSCEGLKVVEKECSGPDG